jgi:riboflavin synthase
MFTGIIEAVGRVEAIEPKGVDSRLQIATGGLDLSDVAIGDSIAVSGICLTVVQRSDRGFWADVSGETLSKTVLGQLARGAKVNLEKALTPTTRLGGHLVSGHVDGVGQLVERFDEGRSVRFRFRAPEDITRYIAPKGSICIDGVSLTVNEVDGAVFGVNIVPHTLEETTIDSYRAGTRVNLEVDIIARYLERLLLGGVGDHSGPGISLELLAAYGYTKDAG